MASLFQVPIPKAGKGITIEVDADQLPLEMYARALEEGLKVLLNGRMSKITTSKLEGEDLAKAQTAALAIATENVEKLMAGTLTKRSGSASKTGVAREVMTEARRLAKEVVKNEIRKAGHKPSQVEAKDITAMANSLIESDPGYIEEAKENLAKRAKAPVPVDLSGVIQVSPRLIAKAADKKKASKEILSKTQAGKVAPRKPRVEQHTSH